MGGQQYGYIITMFFILINTLVNRVRWYRAKADAKRWEEEVDILHAEMTRTYQMFKFLCNIWKQAGNAHGVPKRGYLEFALEHSYMYEKLAKDTNNNIISVDGPDAHMD